MTDVLDIVTNAELLLPEIDSDAGRHYLSCPERIAFFKHLKAMRQLVRKVDSVSAPPKTTVGQQDLRIDCAELRMMLKVRDILYGELIRLTAFVYIECKGRTPHDRLLDIEAKLEFAEYLDLLPL